MLSAALAQQQGGERAIQFLRGASSSTPLCTIDTYTDVLASCDNPAAAEKILSEDEAEGRIGRSVHTYNALMSLNAATGFSDRALANFEEARSKGMTPTLGMYKTKISIYLARSEDDLVISAMDDMHGEGKP